MSKHPPKDPEGLALWHAILDHPEELDRRLVYADWLEEHKNIDPGWLARFRNPMQYGHHRLVAPMPGSFEEWFTHQLPPVPPDPMQQMLGAYRADPARPSTVGWLSRGMLYDLYSSHDLTELLRIAREHPVRALCWEGVEPVDVEMGAFWSWSRARLAQQTPTYNRNIDDLNSIMRYLSYGGEYSVLSNAYADMSRAIIQYARSTR